MSYLIEELRERKTLDNQGLKALLESDDPSLEDELFRNAREVADGQFGHEIWLRALIEWSNVCRNDCYYCGIRRSHLTLPRYSLTPEEILSCCDQAWRLGLRTFVLQGGENPSAAAALAPTVAEMRASWPDAAITLSLGDTTADRSYYYASVNNTSDVYLVRAAGVDFTDEPELTYIDEYVFMVSYTLLSRVDLELLGDKFELLYDARDEKTEDVLIFNGVNTYIDDDHDYRGDFKRIGTAMYGLRLSGLEAEPAEKGELLCRIRYEQHDGTVTTVECFARDDTTMYFYLNGSYVGGYGRQYLLTSDNANYGIAGTVANLCEKLGIPYPQAG